MPKLSWSLPEELSDRPEVDDLRRFLERLRDEKADGIEFVVLFGSMAKGNWSRGSDYDVLIGLRGADERRLIDRMAELDVLTVGNLEIFPYGRPSWERMAAQGHRFVRDALRDGVVLFDRGGWEALAIDAQRAASASL